MSNNRIDQQRSQRFLSKFLAFVEAAKQNPNTDPQFWQNLAQLEAKLREIDDQPPKLATVIKQWCQERGITIDSNQDILRLEIGEDEEAEDPLEGETPNITVNKNIIITALSSPPDDKTEQNNDQPQQ
ncbi:hypothetical protein PN462_12965 [Spirulina sp. CS-785/01]|uniref:hypothetical protein n=1 Tax=Spirulina sp. CS-785/01 TaxID=3021716 RepID=UPI00232FC095|nr:hypothetical protein [Spirulina sp. CS-785/01]MDB9314017.1 hypothetical protein [Spirulina sp. CS-785/01]